MERKQISGYLELTEYDQLEEMMKYYGIKSISSGVSKCITDAYELFKMRKEKDQEIFGDAGYEMRNILNINDKFEAVDVLFSKMDS